MTKYGLFEGYLLLTGGHRHLQDLPDYTSPPTEVALEATPELYRDDEVVQEARDLAGAGNCTIDGNRCHIPFPVDVEKFEEASEVGVVFYNGGLVDPRGYSPIAELLSERYGMPVVMPIFAGDIALSFGSCDSGRLDFAQAEFPEVEKWVLAGHSLGGASAMTDMWSRWNEMDESAAGLVLLAADIQDVGCGATDFSDTDLPMAQVLASNDGILNQTRTALNSVYNSNATFGMDIYGANHASFGAYDSSLRFELLGQVDGEALIPSTVAWDLSAAAIAHVAARTGVPLPTPKESSSADPTVEEVVSTDEGSGEVVDRCPPVVDGVETRSGTASSGATIITPALVASGFTFIAFWI